MCIQIRQIKAEQTWQLRHTVMWPHKAIDYIKLPHDETGVHFGLFKTNALIAVISLFKEKDAIQFRKLATKTSEQGKGYGSMLVTHSIAYAKEKGVSRLWCNARTDKLGFYQKFNLHPTSIKFAKDAITYVIVDRVF